MFGRCGTQSPGSSFYLEVMILRGGGQYVWEVWHTCKPVFAPRSCNLNFGIVGGSYPSES
jgi:hypothetical protein